MLLYCAVICYALVCDVCDVCVSPPQNSHIPTLITALSGTTITHAVFGAAHALALSSTGHIHSWGQNASHQLGRITTAAPSAAWTPALVQWPATATASAKATHIAAGKAHSAVISGGQLYTWGKGTLGVLGHGNGMYL